MTVFAPQPRIYLDHNATTLIDPRVADSMNACQRRQFANPASAHTDGQRARNALDEARDQIARILGAQVDSFPPDTLVLTSGGTEANNLALLGLAGDPPGRILVSAVEHPSIGQAAEHLSMRGFDVQTLPVDREGRVLLESYQQLLTPETRLVSVIWGNNETGVLQPIETLAAMAVQRGVPIHTDAVQVVGKMDVHFQRLGVTALSFSAHKFHGPVGVGGLLLRGRTTIQPILHGGSQQLALRPGTESVPLADGMCRALQFWQAESPARAQRMRELRDRLQAGIVNGLADENHDLVIQGGGAERLPHTLNISFLGLDRQLLLLALDHAGLACSTGSACASGSSEPSPVLLAMSCAPAAVQSALRFSLGAFTNVHDIDLAIECIVRVAKDLRRQSASRTVT